MHSIIASYFLFTEMLLLRVKIGGDTIYIALSFSVKGRKQTSKQANRVRWLVFAKQSKGMPSIKAVQVGYKLLSYADDILCFIDILYQNKHNTSVW